jgi:sugar phosphate isomerase/epimerase
VTPPAGQSAAHPLAVVNPLADTHATIDEDLELCDELGGAKYGLTLGKYRAWTGRAARLAGRVAYVHHGRLFTLDDESAWPGERAALTRTLELAHEVGAAAVLATTGPAGGLTTWEQALSAFAAAYEPLAARADTLEVRVCVEQTNVLRQDAGFVTTLGDLARLAAESGAWICADMFWSWRERDLAGSLRACGPRLGLVQLADAVPTSVSMPDRVVPGDGVVPLGWVIGQFAAAGYLGFFDVELLGPRIAAQGARQAMTRGVRHVSALLRASYPSAPASGTDNSGTDSRGEPR